MFNVFNKRKIMSSIFANKLNPTFKEANAFGY